MVTKEGKRLKKTMTGTGSNSREEIDCVKKNGGGLLGEHKNERTRIPKKGLTNPVKAARTGGGPGKSPKKPK